MRMGYGAERQFTREESLHHERHEEMRSSTTSSTVAAKDLPPEIRDKNLTQILNMHTHGFTQSDDSLTNAMQVGDVFVVDGVHKFGLIATILDKSYLRAREKVLI